MKLSRGAGAAFAAAARVDFRRGTLMRCALGATLAAWSLGACVPALSGAAQARLLERNGLEVDAPVTGSVRATFRLDNGSGRSTNVSVTATDPFIELAASGGLTLPAGAEHEVALTAHCGAGPAVHRGWVVVDSVRGGAQASEVLDVRLVCTAAGGGGTSEPPDLLSWEPPRLDDPVLLRIDPQAASGALQLDPTRDYLLLMPEQPLQRGLNVRGGRNVVLVGGEIDIPWQGANPSVASRRALHIQGATGAVHLEGLLLHGEDISEGIQINAPDAVVTIQNVGVFGIRARDQEGFSDNHPDLIQTYGNARELRVDRFSGTTDYQGLFFVAEFHGPAHGPVTLRRIDIVGAPTARYLLWFDPHPAAGAVQLVDVWLDVPRERSGGLGRAVWPDARGTFPTQARLGEADTLVAWPSEMHPRIDGEVRSGTPPDGPFVTPERVGIGYRSPGYAVADRPVQTAQIDRTP